jgi:hypothetical protein
LHNMHTVTMDTRDTAVSTEIAILTSAFNVLRRDYYCNSGTSNKGHFGTNYRVLCREPGCPLSDVLLQWEILLLGHCLVSFMRSPFLRGSFIGGSTVYDGRAGDC